ncbi:MULTISPECIES: SusC/RagA family TonB-linked outer membrane protein [Polaribacter]|uniref:SusC/RagA family TonB-linked outer membrane protein n=1 Tax=Polaribacter sejongensis TaxID=985043 RepID=A0AAJ1QUS6_9FLAO|nr:MULTISPECIES: SusC/RagA family TonB-linked outer membrane protein [Polaribacter]AUC21837.1 SusC/RagA family TonB-linked outer membrane protein [Polaribacter sejongensis]MDN3618475.1 SusC/RagA family TonB-linked outer membrane protein [Polaribacter undariae]UWD30543.1 SusC/RagA family TonB-linked outer membrane protein [Polaribacter undariae]
MKKNYKLTLSLIVFLIVQSTFAQLRTISGVVTEKGSEIPLPEVSVFISQINKGSVTDFDGNYSIKAEDLKGKTIAFSYLGYKTVTITLTGENQVINAALEADATGLDEIVVTALGIKRAAKSLGYSLTEVGGEDMSAVKSTSAVNSLQGRVAGVNISAGSGGAAGSSRVIIRGASSLTGNNQPLYVIDGIPIINNTNGSVVGATNDGTGDGGDDISSLNPDDIESVSVLKGSSAAALYGSLASNGVIMITTKSGKGQKRMGVELSSSFTFDKINTDLQNFQTTYGQGNNRLKPGYEYDGSGQPVEISNIANAIDDSFVSSLQSWGDKLDGSMVYNWDGTKRPYSNTGNNLDKFYNVGSTVINTVALSKGGEEYNYRLSFSNLDNDDIFPNTTLNRKSISLNASANITPKLTSTVNAKYVIEKVHNRINIGDTPGNANTVAYVLPSSLNITDLKPGFNEEGTELLFQPSQFISNPYWATDAFNNDDKKNRFTASTSLKYDFNDWLYLTGRAGIDTYDLSRRRVTPFGTAYRPAGEMTEAKSTYTLFNGDLMLGINKDLTEKISTSSIIGANTRTSSFESLSALGRGFIVEGLEDINNTTLPEPSFGYSKTKTNSLYGSFEVSYDKYFYLTFTGRNDWFSTLSFPGKTTPNNGFYWSLSQSLLLNELFDLPEQVNYAKFRASYAQVAGGASNAYSLNLDYAITGSFQGQSFGQLNGNSIPNPNLVPFQKNEFEVGFDGRFFQNRLNLDVAYYQNQTTNDIVSASASQSSGFTSSILNIGELQNKGFEFLIGGTPIKTEDFSWYTSFNFGYNDSEIVHTDDEDTAINVDGSQTRSRTAIISHIVGENYGVIWGSSYKRDADGNIMYNTTGSIPKPIQGENKILGQGVAPYTLGFSNSFKYKDFSLNFLIDAKFGGSVHSGTNRELMMRGLHEKTLEGREDGLVVSGIDDATGNPFTMTVAPENLRTYYGFIGEENSGISEEFVYSTDFIKFRELSIAYSLPKKTLENIFVSDVRLSLIGRNLFYISKKIDNVDPEASLNNLNSQGIERFGTPSTRSYGFAINVKF